MADPMLELIGTDKGPDYRAKANENARRRFTPDYRVALDADDAQLATDEMLRVSATTAARTLTLLPATTGNTLHLWISAADATNTYTIDGAGADTVGGTATKVYTATKTLVLRPDGISNWVVFDCT